MKNLNETREAVGEIRRLAGDPEAAASAESKLHDEVFQNIATYSTDSCARELAKAALSTSLIEFPRWRA